jgi:hypothetical protein
LQGGPGQSLAAVVAPAACPSEAFECPRDKRFVLCGHTQGGGEIQVLESGTCMCNRPMPVAMTGTGLLLLKLDRGIVFNPFV